MSSVTSQVLDTLRTLFADPLLGGIITLNSTEVHLRLRLHWLSVPQLKPKLYTVHQCIIYVLQGI